MNDGAQEEDGSTDRGGGQNGTGTGRRTERMIGVERTNGEENTKQTTGGEGIGRTERTNGWEEDRTNERKGLGGGGRNKRLLYTLYIYRDYREYGLKTLCWGACGVMY